MVALSPSSLAYWLAWKSIALLRIHARLICLAHCFFEPEQCCLRSLDTVEVGRLTPYRVVQYLTAIQPSVSTCLEPVLRILPILWSLGGCTTWTRYIMRHAGGGPACEDVVR